jgi:hypothetical protein
LARSRASVSATSTNSQALARIAFGVLVREDGALRLEHARTDVVLRRDQLDVVFLTLTFVLESSVELGVEATDGHRGSEHA